VFSVREVSDNRDLKRLPALEQAIWGNPDPIPPSVLRVVVDYGGAAWVVADDSDPDNWLGLAVALPARDAAGWHLHSHLAGILPGHRGRGAGTALKQRQRRWAAEHGYTRICWTFDPLRADNAHFNLNILGARVVAYHPDYYGPLSSALNGRWPTDRLLVEWPVKPAGGPPAVRGPVVYRVDIPRDIEARWATDPDGVRRQVLAVRDAFRKAFHEGLAVVGFDRGQDHASYLFQAPPSASADEVGPNG